MDERGCRAVGVYIEVGGESASLGAMHVGDKVADRGGPRDVTCWSRTEHMGPIGWTRRKGRGHEYKWQETTGQR